jgi:hypothetical protein
MINAKELRIGNLVEYKITDKFDERKEWWEVSEIDADDIHWLSKVDTNDDDFRAITLTEEWLKKLGFGKSDEHEMGNNLNDNFGFYYDYHFKRFRLECSDNDGLNYADMDLKINYVHQLQNLHFALTQRELTVA